MFRRMPFASDSVTSPRFTIDCWVLLLLFVMLMNSPTGVFPASSFMFSRNQLNGTLSGFSKVRVPSSTAIAPLKEVPPPVSVREPGPVLRKESVPLPSRTLAITLL